MGGGGHGNGSGCGCGAGATAAATAGKTLMQFAFHCNSHAKFILKRAGFFHAHRCHWLFEFNCCNFLAKLIIIIIFCVARHF